MGKSVTNEEILAALISCPTKTEAAKKLGITRRAIYQRLANNSELRLQLKQARAEIILAAVQGVREGLCEAVTVIRGVLNSEDEQTAYRLQAAQILLSSFIKLNAEAARLEASATPPNNEMAKIIDDLERHAQE